MSEERQSAFLQRWSRRKIEAREGELQEEICDPADVAQDAATVADTSVAPSAPPASQPAEPVPPTMDDVQALTSDSDFSRFVVQGVATDVKNAALKKLFSDPHYNVMDGLDTYIDDYSQLAPLPESALRKMAVSRVLGFFEEEARCAPAASAEGVQARAEELNDPRVDGAMPDAGAAALPMPAERSAGPAPTDVPQPAAREKP